MSVFRKYQSTARVAAGQFLRDRRGAVLPLFVLVAVLVFGAGGMAIDYGRGSLLRSRLNAAVDAASLASVRAASDLSAADPNRSKTDIANQAEEIGHAFLVSNITSMHGASVLKSEIKLNFENGAWKVDSDVRLSVPTTLGGVVGWNAMAVSAKSSASMKAPFPVLDIAMCIDSTGSMTPTLDAVKNNALSFYSNLNTELNNRGIPSFALVRVRMIYFKDFGDITAGYWDADAQRSSQFFALPTESSDFSAFASPQTAGGGGDIPESGLECLNEAIDSVWTKVGDRPAGFSETVTDVYPLIVVWTDAPSHPLPFPNSLANPAYPPAAKMPRNYTDFRAKWSDAAKIDQSHKQILYFGDPAITSADQGGFVSGWEDVRTWPKFQVGGTLTEANTMMVEFIATGIANTARDLRITQ